jgi:hypothetical protein
MTKHKNKADLLVFKALQRAVAEDKIHLYLIHSKINVPSSPVYNPWEVVLPILVPVLLGLVLIGLVGVFVGFAVMIAGIMLSANFIKKNMDQKLFDRTKNMLIADYDSCENLWNFGGIVLVKAEDTKQGCVAPEGSWKEFVILNFADLMTEHPVQSPAPEATHEKVA